MARKAQFRRASSLSFYFDDDRLCCKNYLTGVEVASAPSLIGILERLGRWRTMSGIECELGEYSRPSVRRTVRELLRHSLLVRRGSEQHRRERVLAHWTSWGVEARQFHFATKNVEYETDYDESQLSRELLARSPLPPSVKHYPRARRIALPSPAVERDDVFRDVLLSRRSVRRFGPGKVPLEKLATLLRLTWGFTGTIDWPGLGKVPVRTSPSGGARQALEVYVLARRVARLPSGLYHYRADRHELERLRQGVGKRTAALLCGGQSWVEESAALFFFTAVLPRVTWRYAFSRAYRVLLLEAGHLCQTFCLVATWLGLGPFCTAALADDEIETLLGVERDGEPVLYVAGVGEMPDAQLERAGGKIGSVDSRTRSFSDSERSDSTSSWNSG